MIRKAHLLAGGFTVTIHFFVKAFNPYLKLSQLQVENAAQMHLSH